MGPGCESLFVSLSPKLLCSGRRAHQWSSQTRTRSASDARSGWQSASAIQLKGDSSMTRMPWLQTTGGIVAILLLTQFCTGVLLAFYYVPSVDHAYTTVSYIEKVVSSGTWLRSVHHYGSQWLAVFVFLHVIQL